MTDNQSNKCNFRIGNGYDVHQIQKGGQLWLGGVSVSNEYSFIAHSDGDVAIHALCDALLGCLALGDIGKHFPDNSDKWKGIDSKILLKHVCNLIWSKNWSIGNVDITIALQSPKIGIFVNDMQKTLSKIMQIDTDCVSIKATTTEKMGFVGRGEGCQVWATALLYK